MQMVQYWDFNRARAYVRGLQIHKRYIHVHAPRKKWDLFSATERPAHIPGSPWKVYRGQWHAIQDWLEGCGENKTSRNAEYCRTYRARKKARNDAVAM